MTLVARELTAPGAGAVSVLELAGAGALARVAALAGTAPPAPGGFRLVRLRDAGELLDEALLLVHSPERVELHLHGSPALLARVVAVLGAERPAAAARTLEERAEALLARARTPAAARMLLDQAEGALRRELAALDPADPSGSFAAALGALLRRGRVAEALVEPRRVVLAGPVNAGKSTLFNALLGRERVVVSDEPGTTRDAVREPASLGAYPVELVDVAGERPLAPDAAGGGAGAIEAAGQARGREVRAAADLVLWLSPAPELPAPDSTEATGPAPRSAAPRRVLVSRGDLLGREALPQALGGVPVVAARDDPVGARRVVARLFHEALDLPLEPWEPGRGAPFEPPLREALAALLAAEPDERRRVLARILAT